MAVSPYAEESLRVLHERAFHSCTTLIRCSDATTLTTAITRLSAREQVVLALIYFEGFEIVEVAGILEQPMPEVISFHALAVLALSEHIVNATAESR